MAEARVYTSGNFVYSHYRHRYAPDLDKHWVVTTVFNPRRFRSRYDLYQRFKTGCERAGANLLTVEVAFGDRPFEVTQADHPHHVQLRTSSEIWLKENSINLGISRLPRDWRYVTWADADVEFVRHDWCEEIVHQLQHFHVVQGFQNAIDLGPNGEVLKSMEGFVYSWMHGLPTAFSKGSGPHWHPGYVWSARREAVDGLGGLFDVAILGAADHHMAWALLGRVIENSPRQLAPSYKRHLEAWQERASRHIRQNIGYVPGSIYHHFHGKKVDRKYVERWSILFKHKYDPDFDLQRDWQGLYALSDAGLRMRNDIRGYFVQRNEDSIDL